MTKWDYIQKISQMSDMYGNLLLSMMDKYNKNCLLDITEEEAKEFYDDQIKKS